MIAIQDNHTRWDPGCATLNPNADLGPSSAAQVNLVTKSGTNDFHGAGFEFYRTKGFTANNFFNNSAGVERSPLLRHTFGGEIDGPIIKNKIFFMYSYEARRDTTATNVVQQVPLPSMGRGELRYVDADGAINTLTTAQLNSIFPDVGMNPVGIAVLADAAKKYPANDFTLGDSLPGTLLPAGSPSQRNFATQDYDFYVQDAWKMRPNLTLTVGLRYGLSRPVYETNGYEVRPTIPLGQYFNNRLTGMALGTPYNDPVFVF